MAKLDSKRPEGNWELGNTGNIFEEQERLLAELEKVSSSLNGNDVVGAIIRFPIADGYALYRVTKEKPLTIQHIPFGDAWSIDSAYIRGLRLVDVKALISRERRLRKIFA